LVGPKGSALSASPKAAVGLAGVTVIEFSAVTVRLPSPPVVVLIIELEVAVIATVPPPTAVARPKFGLEVLTVATEAFPVLQATVSVMF
jgi:hypothetical protein